MQTGCSVVKSQHHLLRRPVSSADTNADLTSRPSSEILSLHVNKGSGGPPPIEPPGPPRNALPSAVMTLNNPLWSFVQEDEAQSMIPIVTPVIVYERDCPQCGQKVSRGYSTCPHCGAELPKAARSSRLIILGLVLALIGGVVLSLRYI
jgi:hypothetical protein